MTPARTQLSAATVPSAAEFLEATVQFRASEPALTNLVATVAAGVVAGRRYERCLWWLVRDPAGRVVGCACRTTPYPLVMSSMSPAAAAALGVQVRLVDPALPGVTGPRAAVDALLAELDPAGEPRTRMTELVKVLQTYLPPSEVPGRARRASAEEQDLLVAWFQQFQRDAGLIERDPRANVAAMLANHALWWWKLDGRPVSMAGHGLVVDGIGRVGPVFTPATHRRHGYGAAVTGAVVAELLTRCTTVLLFSDASNSTSNRVYERLGFVTAAQFVEVELP